MKGRMEKGGMETGEGDNPIFPFLLFPFLPSSSNYPRLANKNLPSLSKNIWYLSVPTVMFT